jgi:hypothetical protein
VDTSTGWSIALVINGEWLAWQFKEEWNSKGQEIGWGEMVAVKLVIWTLIMAKFSNMHIVICSNNQGVVEALKAGRLQDTQQNAILCKIVRLVQGHNLWISTIWISTAENLADNPLRGIFTGKKSLCAFPPKIPFHLAKFVHNAVDYQD